jgi:hypothetical protein
MDYSNVTYGLLSIYFGILKIFFITKEYLLVEECWLVMV